jgi:hypothetical protein
LIYFRRPQTPFVQEEGSQKPQSQWKIVASDKRPETNGNSSHGLGDGSGHAVEDDLVEKDPAASSNKEGEATSDNSTTDNDTELATSLDKRLQLEIKHHPESVLLCGYFKEERVDNYLTLSTFLPGVHAPELRISTIIWSNTWTVVCHGRSTRQYSRMQAIFQDGMILIRVPLVIIPPGPLKIEVLQAKLMFHFMNRSELFCLEIQLPRVQLKDLTLEYHNGTLRLLWERFDGLTMMRFERLLPIDTLQI